MKIRLLITTFQSSKTQVKCFRKHLIHPDYTMDLLQKDLKTKADSRVEQHTYNTKNFYLCHYSYLLPMLIKLSLIQIR